MKRFLKSTISRAAFLAAFGVFTLFPSGKLATAFIPSASPSSDTPADVQKKQAPVAPLAVQDLAPIETPISGFESYVFAPNMSFVAPEETAAQKKENLEERIEARVLEALAKKDTVSDEEGRTEIVRLKRGRLPIQAMLNKLAKTSKQFHYDKPYVASEISQILAALPVMQEGHAFAVTYDKNGAVTHIHFRGSGWDGGDLWCVYHVNLQDLKEAPAAKSSPIKIETKKKTTVERVVAPSAAQTQADKVEKGKTSAKKVRRAQRAAQRALEAKQNDNDPASHVWAHRSKSLQVTPKPFSVTVPGLEKGENIWNKIVQSGGSNGLAKQVTALFNNPDLPAYRRLDLNKLPKGSSVHILAEDRMLSNGEKLGESRILFAKVSAGGHDYTITLATDPQTGTEVYVDGPGRSVTKFLQMPEGRLNDGFGDREHPIFHVMKWHSGQDINKPNGAPVFVANAGTVINVEKRGGYGNFVRVYHGFGISTCYAHLKGFSVKIGQKLARGCTVGPTGKTGTATGFHVHYEVRLGSSLSKDAMGTPVDPLAHGFLQLEGRYLAAVNLQRAGYATQLAALESQKRMAEVNHAVQEELASRDDKSFPEIMRTYMVQKQEMEKRAEAANVIADPMAKVVAEAPASPVRMPQVAAGHVGYLATVSYGLVTPSAAKAIRAQGGTRMQAGEVASLAAGLGFLPPEVPTAGVKASKIGVDFSAFATAGTGRGATGKASFLSQLFAKPTPLSPLTRAERALASVWGILRPVLNYMPRVA